ncbi:peptide chain release factor 1 [Candidatus Marinimicrobia bacterium]|jgi:peptide chain release factor 1|nr:peptide chain release factor 1 [Candidatus Neomarinimicrobiota bacterium]MDA9841267.1 peptide chain release factor 1 [Candidatus Neomarinimicrobiota bacterium]MDB3883577.1 peptide chain release factor 1 [Candidatus Neomarinimicrobiota bacterium]MDB3980447.1 peptide chain release factor 1 [Candidatus Neomarinimicrobiota bacterium]MDC0654123.1 peptide chain release factor 1 [Candidatus Neomarinimicrobiota bacterium]|tara:strand:- start:3736 stop:4794 length:1059 start_codon:yes stop_codon:yes gene_type:complete
MDILSKANSTIVEYDNIMQEMMDPSNVLDQEKLASLSKQKSSIQEVYDLSIKFVALTNENDELDALDGEEGYADLVKEEKEVISSKLTSIENALIKILITDDPNDNKSAIIELRAGTGGDEAALFAADLFRMYSRYAEKNNLSINIMDIHETGVGGLKSVIFSAEGHKAYGIYKYEGGVHRVQRIPKTESGGRVHTSAATVAVLPEAEKAELDINEATDIKVDTYRASGAGGQHVNKTESAIRLTHIPTGLVVTCQDQASQHKNKASALKVMRARLFALEQEKLNKDRDEMRKSLVSTGDRSAKIRTYNFPQGRITDHRINYTTHKLQVTLEGDLDHIIEQLKLAEDNSKIN